MNHYKNKELIFNDKSDFFCVDPSESAKEVKTALFNHINDCIKEFILYYGKYDLPDIKVNRNNAISSLKSLASSVRMTPQPVYLLIDEYNNFANTVMMGVQSAGKRYETLVHDEGPLRTFFKAVKASTSGSMLNRIFITGVSPVVMSDITSGYNIAKNIYFEPELNDLYGFKQNESEDVLKEIINECGFEKKKIKEAANLIQTYYNGYTFSHLTDEHIYNPTLCQPLPESKKNQKKLTDEHIYNPTLCLYFFEQFEKRCSYPREMLDSNLAMDESKLDYIDCSDSQMKTAFLTLLYNDIIYIMDSETEIDHRYADLTMIIRPDKRYGKIFNILIEFKFVKLKDAKTSADKAQKLFENELMLIPEIANQIKDGEKQVQEYGNKLEQKYKNLRLHKFVVVALGFERVCFKKLN